MGCNVDESCPSNVGCPTNSDCDGHQIACGGNIAAWTDDPLVAGTTLVRDIHISELRTAIDDERTDTVSPRRGAATQPACSVNTPGSYTFADDPLVVGITDVRDDHINELADAVNTTEFNVSGDSEGPDPAVVDPLVNFGDVITLGDITTLRDAINVVRSNCICDTQCTCNFNCSCDEILVCDCNIDAY